MHYLRKGKRKSLNTCWFVQFIIGHRPDISFSFNDLTVCKTGFRHCNNPVIPLLLYENLVTLILSAILATLSNYSLIITKF